MLKDNKDDNSLRYDSKQRRVIEILSHLFFVFTLAISFVQYLERTLPFDGAFYCFKILYFDWFNIENGRWGAFYNQILPLIGLKIGCSLSVFLKLYSMSFALCNYLFFIIIFYRFKQPGTALALVLLQALLYRYNFYYQVSEIHAIIGPVFLLLATLQSKKLIEKNYLIFFVLLLFIWIINIHLLSIIVVGYILVYCLIENPVLIKNKMIIIGVALSLAYFLYYYLSIPKDSYQGNKLITFQDLRFVFTNLKETAGYKHFKIAFHQNYYLISSVLIFSIIYFVIKKYFMKLFLMLFSVAAFWLINMAYNINHEAPINLENYYPVFGYFILIPFCIDVLKSIKPLFLFLFLFFLLFFSGFKIIKSSIFFSDQVSYYKRVSDNLRKNYKEKKFILSDKHIDWDKIWMDWDIPFQSLIISSLNHPDSTVTFFTSENVNLYKETTCCDTMSFVGVRWSPFWFSSKDFPKKYFNLKNTTYKLVTTSQDTEFKILDFNNHNLKFELVESDYVLINSNYRTIPVKITNLSEQYLKCAPTKNNNLSIGYEIIKPDSKEVVQKGVCNIETDIPAKSTIETGVKIITHSLKRDNYILLINFKINRNIEFGKSSIKIRLI